MEHNSPQENNAPLENWQPEYLSTELKLVQQLRNSIRLARLRLRLPRPGLAVHETELQVAREYIGYSDLEDKLTQRITLLEELRDGSSELGGRKLDEVLDHYSHVISGLATVGGAAFSGTIVLIFTAVRGAPAFMRWSSLLFAVSFFLPMLVQATARFKPMRRAIPTFIRFVIPLFVVAIAFLEFSAFVFLYIAAVALDFRPEVDGDKPPVLVFNPPLPEDGNYVPGIIMGAGLIVVGSVWVWAGVRWLWHKRRGKLVRSVVESPA